MSASTVSMTLTVVWQRTGRLPAVVGRTPPVPCEMPILSTQPTWTQHQHLSLSNIQHLPMCKWQYCMQSCSYCNCTWKTYTNHRCCNNIQQHNDNNKLAYTVATHVQVEPHISRPTPKNESLFGLISRGSCAWPPSSLAYTR